MKGHPNISRLLYMAQHWRNTGLRPPLLYTKHTTAFERHTWNTGKAKSSLKHSPTTWYCNSWVDNAIWNTQPLMEEYKSRPAYCNLKQFLRLLCTLSCVTSSRADVLPGLAAVEVRLRGSCLGSPCPGPILCFPTIHTSALHKIIQSTSCSHLKRSNSSVIISLHIHDLGSFNGFLHTDSKGRGHDCTK